MNDSRFIELLNLYVDQQLSAAEAAELESEITRNPNRRRTYQQYCRMQKACTVLFDQERTKAPARSKLAAALAEADRKVSAGPDGRKNGLLLYFPAAGLAAAACVAFVIWRHSPASSPVAVATVAAPAPDAAQSVSIVTAAQPAASTQAARNSFYTALTTRRPNLVVSDKQNNLAENDASGVSTVSYSWMREVELAPVQGLSGQQLSLKPVNSASRENRLLRSSKSVDSTDEAVIFQFQR